MISSWTPFHSFWSSPWSLPLRNACIWLKRVPAPVVPATPDALAPNWIRPLCLQRVIGRAIGARIRWMREHPDQSAFLFPTDAIPLWTREAWTPFARSALRAWNEERLLLLFEIEVERLLRLMQVPPGLMGEEVWTHAVLGACEHLAQLYHEFRRRFGARRVRRFVREVLLDYIYWEPEPPDGDSEAAAEAEADEAEPLALAAPQ
jgi:hypothetical protein